MDGQSLVLIAMFMAATAMLYSSVGHGGAFVRSIAALAILCGQWRH